MDEVQLKTLLEKYTNGTCSPEEIILLESWYLARSEQDKLPAPGSGELRNYRDLIWAGIQQQTGINQKLVRAKAYPIGLRIAAAASLLIFLSIGLYFYLNKPANAPLIANHLPHDIAPGSNKAILTLAKGQKISLTDAKNGTIATQNQTVINKTADGQLVYAASATATTAFNSIQTPRGGQYHLTLADGTQVWLNAASGLRYPSAFTGKERKVELTGEAYFEVAHNSARPFLVVAAGETVEDIGTHFNINAYQDEPAIKTTLLEGSVRVSEGAESKILKPGQQSQLNGGNAISVISGADLDDEAVAWKNGKFIFSGENIQSIMRKVSRWYDVDVVYRGKVTGNDFIGTFSRYKNVSEVLNVLKLTKTVHFKIEGRRIIVMP